ncbi:hypothetical protein [Roseimaritima multifibrata]|uniref:hypothetical protein n=1 Tax=Roseimaritima multifibrata TaxID=1930274 RepID=UPI0011A7D3B4|nr:hypothetical protein [Roseimaritima multifibrata]
MNKSTARYANGKYLPPAGLKPLHSTRMGKVEIVTYKSPPSERRQPLKPQLAKRRPQNRSRMRAC